MRLKTFFRIKKYVLNVENGRSDMLKLSRNSLSKYSINLHLMLHILYCRGCFSYIFNSLFPVSPNIFFSEYASLDDTVEAYPYHDICLWYLDGVSFWITILLQQQVQCYGYCCGYCSHGFLADKCFSICAVISKMIKVHCQRRYVGLLLKWSSNNSRQYIMFRVLRDYESWLS